MQSDDGGWGAFDADNTLSLVRELPFLDFGEVIDEPSADVSAHAVEMLAALELLDTPAARRGVRWLISQQEPDGSWFGRWGVNHVYGTGAAVPALIAAGVAPARAVHPPRGRMAGATIRTRTAAGARIPAPTTIPRGSAAVRAPPRRPPGRCWRCTPPGETDSPALGRGVDWLVSTQRADGTWDEPQYTGTGFPSDYYINYHLYRLVFPIMALGRCLRGVRLLVDPADRRSTVDAVMGRAAGENFPVASRVLPRAIRAHLLALYGFARLVDELGDGALPGLAQDPSPQERLAALDGLKRDLDRAYRGEAEHPLLQRLEPTLARVRAAARARSCA